MEDFMKAAVLTLLASSLLVAPVAFSRTTTQSQEKERTRPTAEEMVNRHVDQLAVVFNLTPDQKMELNKSFTSTFNEDRNVESQLRADRVTLKNDVKAKADQAKLTADAKAIGNDEAKIVANDACAQEKFVSMLNSEQQAKYDKLQGTWIGGYGASGWVPGAMAPGAFYR